ncbi:MAG TPA: ATP-binding protein [Vicinamibacterales bacterium]|nr:ATP-binding protein [Vicinamibacterales bacterium]
MRAPRLRLQYRILLPTVAAALLATAATAYVGARVTASALRSRLESQLVHSASAVAWRDFALNSRILASLSDVVGVEVVTLSPSAEVLASSLDARTGAVIDAARAVAPMAPAGDVPPRVSEADCGYPCLLAARQVDGIRGTVVVLAADLSPLASATAAVVRTMLVSAALSIAVLIVISHVVARRVTAPLDRLVRFVSTSSPQNAARAEVGDDEIGALAASFNTMLDRLDQSRVALVRSEKLGLAGLFAARVAHDIRNPLSSIKMQTQLLHSKLAAGTEDRETLAAVLHDVGQVESVVRDLMDLANPGALALRPGDLNAVLRDALEQLSAQLAYRKIRVETALDGALPAVAVDAQRLRQAIVNVLVNGSEAMHTGGELRVSTGIDGATVWARICDDGVGIDPALAERAFDPFVSTKPEGVGLGLVNVKSVVEGHGGGIRLEPRQPRGTCAYIWLPVPEHG